MAHQSQGQYIISLKEKFPNFFNNSTVLEIGSLDINGSARIFFNDCKYTGIDIGPGNGVDIICEGQKFGGNDNYYDTVFSCECFEHNPFWLETFLNMWRMCKPNGLIFFTCATTGRPEHGTAKSEPFASPLTIEKGWNYYKNLTEQDFIEKVNFWYFFKEFKFSVNQPVDHLFDLYFYGVKRS